MRIPSICLSTLASLILPMDRPAAQAGSYSFFGEGCQGRSSPFFVPDVPRIGQRFVVRSGWSCNGRCVDWSDDYFVMTGGSNTSFGGITLPFDPWSFRLPICGLWRIAVSHVAITQDVNSFVGEVGFMIPDDPCLVGASFYQQIFVMVCGWEGCSYWLSRGGHGVIGR